MAPRIPDHMDRVMTEIRNAMADRTKRLSRLGNSVVPQVAHWIGIRILEAHRRMGYTDD